MIRVFEINFPSLYLRDCREARVSVSVYVRQQERERRLAGAVHMCVNLAGTCTLSPVPIKGGKSV